jgi:nitrate/nitrite transport system permease protein
MSPAALKLAHPAAAAPAPSGPKPTPPAPPLPPAAAVPAPRFAAAGRAASGAAAAVLPPLVTLAVLLAAWEILCSAPGATLPPPSQVLADTWPLIVDPFYTGTGVDQGLFWQMAASLERVAKGYALAVVAGVAMGALIGQSVWATRGLDPIFQVLRTVPPLAWLPLSLAAFQSGEPSAIFVIFITAVWPIIINTAVGVRNIPADYRNVARVLRLTPAEYFTKIMLPSAAPYIFTGLRIGVGLSWLAIVAAEMLIGGVGIGFFIWDAWNSSRISDIILALVCVGVVGFLLDRAIAALAGLATRGVAAS